MPPTSMESLCILQALDTFYTRCLLSSNHLTISVIIEDWLQNVDKDKLSAFKI